MFGDLAQHRHFIYCFASLSLNHTHLFIDSLTHSFSCQVFSLDFLLLFYYIYAEQRRRHRQRRMYTIHV